MVRGIPDGVFEHFDPIAEMLLHLCSIGIVGVGAVKVVDQKYNVSDVCQVLSVVADKGAHGTIGTMQYQQSRELARPAGLELHDFNLFVFACEVRHLHSPPAAEKSIENLLSVKRLDSKGAVVDSKSPAHGMCLRGRM